MKIIEVIRSLLPNGTGERYYYKKIGAESIGVGFKTEEITFNNCPAWPPDLFAIVATIIDKSSCYTFAGPNFLQPESHSAYLHEVNQAASEWVDLENIPPAINTLWNALITTHSDCELIEICKKLS